MEGTKSDIIGNVVEEDDGFITETEEEVDEEIEVFTTEAEKIGVSKGKPRDRHDTCYFSISYEIENEKKDESVVNVGEVKGKVNNKKVEVKKIIGGKKMVKKWKIRGHMDMWSL